MKYNFEIRTAFTDEEMKEITSQTVEGLEASSQVVIEAKIDTNTELPEDKVEVLRQAVGKLVSDKLGSEVETLLISQEH